MRAAALVAILLLAGCVAPGGPLAPDAPDAAGAAPVEVDVSLSGCREVGAGRFVSFDDARALLPPGFEPADAAGFLGMPAPAGRAAVLTGHLVCEGSVLDGAVAWADLIVPIERPDVPALDLDPGKGDVYQLAQFTNGRATADLFASVGFAVHLADVASAPVLLGGSRAATTVDGEEIVRFEALGTVEQTFRLDTRFWHATPTGLAYVHHVRTPTPMRLGTLVACEAAAGSPFAEAFGTTSCGGPDSLAGVFAEPSDMASTFRHFPGARVAPDR